MYDIRVERDLLAYYSVLIRSVPALISAAKEQRRIQREREFRQCCAIQCVRFFSLKFLRPIVYAFLINYSV